MKKAQIQLTSENILGLVLGIIAILLITYAFNALYSSFNLNGNPDNDFDLLISNVNTLIQNPDVFPRQITMPFNVNENNYVMGFSKNKDYILNDYVGPDNCKVEKIIKPDNCYGSCICKMSCKDTKVLVDNCVNVNADYIFSLEKKSNFISPKLIDKSTIDLYSYFEGTYSDLVIGWWKLAMSYRNENLKYDGSTTLFIEKYVKDDKILIMITPKVGLDKQLDLRKNTNLNNVKIPKTTVKKI